MEILLDMDGVLCDFYAAALEACDLPRDTQPVWDFWSPYITTEEFWQRIHDRAYFWEDLEPYPWMQDLVDACRSLGQVWFCSAPGPDRDSASGKLAWLRRHKLLDGDNYILTPHKHLLSAADRILIDDSVHNVSRFVHAKNSGALLFPQPWNAGDFVDPLDPSELVGWLKGDPIPEQKKLSLVCAGYRDYSPLFRRWV